MKAHNKVAYINGDWKCQILRCSFKKILTLASLFDGVHSITWLFWLHFICIQRFFTWLSCVATAPLQIELPPCFPPLIDIRIRINLYIWSCNCNLSGRQGRAIIHPPFMDDHHFGRMEGGKVSGWRHSFVALLCPRLLCVGSATFPFPAFVRTSLLSVRKNERPARARLERLFVVTGHILL